MWLAYLRLFRLPNVFTALADVAAGFLLVQAAPEPVITLACLALASALLYTGGVVLNDVFDREVDAIERPERPLPSGRISWRAARALGYALLVAGVVAGGAAGYCQPLADAVPWRSGAVAVALAACILAYDGWLKPTPAGPLGMGACRMLNVLLGMSTGVPALTEWNLAGYGVYQLVVAGGIGVYIVGVTWFARTEARESRRWPLVLATAVMLSGVGLLAFLHRTLPLDRPPRLASEGTWMLLLALLAATILRRCAVAVAHPAPAPVQMAVRHAILSLIVLDAAVVAEASDWRYGAGVLVLLVPALLVGRWIEST